MSGNPISIQHQRHAPLLSEGTLQGPGTHRTSRRQTQALQTYRAAMREDGAELRLLRRACSRLHLDQIRPHGLEDYAGKPVGVLVRTTTEMADVLANNPFTYAAPNRTMAIFLD